MELSYQNAREEKLLQAREKRKLKSQQLQAHSVTLSQHSLTGPEPKPAATLYVLLPKREAEREANGQAGDSNLRAVAASREPGCALQAVCLKAGRVTAIC
jgi:hypothetical protein